MTFRGLSSLVILLFTLILTGNLVAATTKPDPQCLTATCGNLSIPFPFGMTPDCYLDDSFLITCNSTLSKPFLRKSNIEILEIKLDGQIKVASSVAKICYNGTGDRIKFNQPEFTLKTFSISSTLNKFTVTGCDTYAYVKGIHGKNYSVGCMSLCNRLDDIKEGACSGIGCCQATIPDGVRNFEVIVRSLSNHTNVLAFNPCGYAFVTDESFKFSSAYLNDSQDGRKVPTGIDYAVGNLTCEEAQKNSSSYACVSEYSGCKTSSTGQGYYCNCLPGFEGNPYLEDGCKDIEECKRTPNPCKGLCKELPGNYSCYCADGFDGDGWKEACRKKNHFKENTFLNAALGVISTLLVLVMGSSWMYHVSRKRKILKLREEFFLKNGGLMLQEKLAKPKGCADRSIIFTEEDLNKATDNFSPATVIGKGGFGTVHKGVLSDNRVVAIKKSKVTDQSQNEQFINEVIIVSEINHRHVVKLLGCCLETEVPLLVYEFITNGTLYSHIHDEHLSSKFTWDIRLKVAAETADALAYLHSAASVPIIHRDVKTVNILLDQTYTAKIADFGASRFIPLDKTQLTTLIQGTFGYLDPEYFHSSQLTDKSDVYSFGVVLAELLTGEEAVSFNKSEQEKNLAMHFVSSITHKRFLEILDQRLVAERNVEQIIEVALLAKRCLNVKAEERPSMKEVSMELEGLKVMHQHPWTENDLNPEESEYLLNSTVSSSSQNGFLDSTNSGCSTTAAYDSMNDQIIVNIDNGR